MVRATGAERDPESHWNAAYENSGSTGVSWYQPTATVSLRLVHCLSVPTDAAVIDVGGGAAPLVDALLHEGFVDLTVLDVSGVALGVLAERLDAAVPVTLVHQDVLTWSPERTYGLWHDRAVFHFLVDPAGRARYLETLRRAVANGGAVVLGTFAPGGPERCSGLPVLRYSAEELVAMLGPEFVAVEQLHEEHVTPAGATQPFTWVAARRR
jgi:hypothetical protein